MKTLISCLSFLILLSCVNHYKIKIYKDGSANVKEVKKLIYKKDILKKDSSLVDVANFIGEKDPEFDEATITEDKVKHFITSDLIDNYKWKSNLKIYFKSSYKIKEIDSLGSFLFKEDSILVPEFKFSQKEFEIKCSPEDTTFWNDDYYDGIFIEFDITFPYNIEKIICNNMNVEYKFKKNKIWISSNLRPFFFRKNPTIINIFFKED